MDYRKILGLGAIFLLSLNLSLPVKAQFEQKNIDNSTLLIDVTLKTQNNQTFDELIQQAETQAVSLIEQEFVSNPSATEIALTILGDRQGQQVPLLFSRVSRSDWQKQPAIRPWTKYFATSAVLLGFNNPENTPPTPVQSTPSTPPPKPSEANKRSPSRVEPTSNATPTPPPPPSPNNASPGSGGASLEETDPGYR